MVTLDDHAEAQQEQIRVAEVVIQQLRTAGTPTNPPSPSRATSQKQVTEGGAFKALTKYTGNPSEYHGWAFSARRVLSRADERFGGLLRWISGQIDEIKESDVLQYRRTTEQLQLTSVPRAAGRRVQITPKSLPQPDLKQPLQSHAAQAVGLFGHLAEQSPLTDSKVVSWTFRRASRGGPPWM